MAERADSGGMRPDTCTTPVLPQAAPPTPRWALLKSERTSSYRMQQTSRQEELCSRARLHLPLCVPRVGWSLFLGKPELR